MQGASCEEEQGRFLDWLVELIEEQNVDVLVVAGDVFHRDQPAAYVLRMYYRFLARCAFETSLRQVVIVGGNHDSPARLDAPAEVLSALKVHVVGGLMADEESWERCLCPVPAVNETGGEGVDAVVVAVPYVQEAKLGIVTTSGSSAEVREKYAERFRYLYGKLADLAEERYPGVPLIATGHLTVETDDAAVEKGDYLEEIHQVGTISGLPPTIFDARYRYVALGHIHRMFPVEGKRVWYCGTPVATSRNEISPRFVLVVDTDVEPGEGFRVEKLKVPVFRPVRVLEGSKDEVCEQISALPMDNALVPYLFIDVFLESPDELHLLRGAFEKRIAESFAEGKRPRIVDQRERLVRVGEEVEGSEATDVPSLKLLEPEQVFERLYAERFEGHGPGEDYLRAFRYLLSTYHERGFEAAGAPVFGDAPAQAVTEQETLEGEETF
jgi:DNA repair protein SbcD/Mre11